MKRMVYRLKAGSLKAMKTWQEEMPALLPNEVWIAVKAIGLNFADVFAIWGLYKATPKEAFIPGLEYAGEVIACGDQVQGVRKGDHVMGVTRFGAYASHLSIDYRYVLPLPSDWTFEAGASYLVQVLTAYYGLIELGNIQKNDTVLIHSAAGGVGIWANRIAKQFASFTVGTVGNQAKVAFCKQEGYNEVIVRGKDFRDSLQQALGERELKIVMECIGGKILTESFNAMAPMSRLIVYGSAQYATPGNRPNYIHLIRKYLTRPRIDPQNMTNLNKSVMAFNLIWLFERVEIMHRILGNLEQMNLGKPHVGHTFPFPELPEAIRLFQTGKTMGKVVVTLEDSMS
ncbi:MAG: zinc-binding dehydrogenase [Bacteroidota bacterium]